MTSVLICLIAVLIVLFYDLCLRFVLVDVVGLIVYCRLLVFVLLLVGLVCLVCYF